jgi:hypothetical protein
MKCYLFFLSKKNEKNIFIQAHHITLLIKMGEEASNQTQNTPNQMNLINSEDSIFKLVCVNDSGAVVEVSRKKIIRASRTIREYLENFQDNETDTNENLINSYNVIGVAQIHLAKIVQWIEENYLRIPENIPEDDEECEPPEIMPIDDVYFDTSSDAMTPNDIASLIKCASMLDISFLADIIMIKTGELIKYMTEEDIMAIAEECGSSLPETIEELLNESN